MVHDRVIATGRSIRRFIVTTCLLGPAVLLWLLRIRFLWVTNPDRIGHLAAEPDAYLKQKRLGLLPRHIGILVVPVEMAANRALLALWRRVMPCVSGTFGTRVALAFRRFRFLWPDFKAYVAAEIAEPATYYRILADWGRRPPLLKVGSELIERGGAALAQLGVPAGAWFACIHVREPGYSLRDDHLHDYRNCDINNFLGAVEEVARRGGWCVRMGVNSATELPSHPRLVDYARSAWRSDWMDLYLCGQCRIFVGTTSGLIMVPTVLGKPCVTTNFVPISRPPVSTTGLGIPKLLRDRRSGRLLTFAEMVAGEPTMPYTRRDSIPGIEILENEPEEIREVVREALEELDGKSIFSEADRARARRFLSIYPERHFAAHARSRISPAFLRKYERLLPPS